MSGDRRRAVLVRGTRSDIMGGFLYLLLLCRAVPPPVLTGWTPHRCARVCVMIYTFDERATQHTNNTRTPAHTGFACPAGLWLRHTNKTTSITRIFTKFYNDTLISTEHVHLSTTTINLLLLRTIMHNYNYHIHYSYK